MRLVFLLEEPLMLTDDKTSSIPFSLLNVTERLNCIDFLTTTITDLIYTVAADTDSNTVLTLLEINWMLTVMREELAMFDNPSSAEIIDRAFGLIRAMQTLADDRPLPGTFH
ncbi:hypothetical protein ACXHXG_16245 [Rhizobium sp. LEGMi198b]|uniref:hypothetical protein n=1 Tax=unclassified Rhizobium TaxID=2613769 RepID=UPI000CF2EED9|nr:MULTISPECIES: hypothetical protein [Rhizobium]MDK4741507.1 hypothetical protein [Rhizobium sp. CNPSo 3464]UWU24041.1 hypothetical protein N2601_27790 [Rhizobium tropici]WFU04963.1 hypothetical protein QA648_29910 [Rhizobium sp. CB3171]